MAGKGQADQRGDEDKRCLQADWSPQAADPVIKLGISGRAVDGASKPIE